MGRSGVIFVLLVSLTSCLAEDFRRTDIVRTRSGPVRGFIKNTVWHSKEYSSFLGIPFAKPPVGDLRFRPPVPATPWTNVYDAVKEGSVCPQVDAWSKKYTGNEDCLYLNVFTPEFGSNTTLKPVMVWVFAGAYVFGYGNEEFYGPDFIVEEDVILVTFNYRLGVLGNLALNHPHAMGNQAMKDQAMVLEWVQQNILDFGGDPNRVTVFGASSGAASIGLHMISDRSRGLFHQSIMMSGSALCQWGYHTPLKAQASAVELAVLMGHVGIDKEALLQFFLNATVERMVLETEKVDFSVLPFRPTVEDTSVYDDGTAFLTDCPYRKVMAGDFTPQPVILGRTTDEVLFFLDNFAGKPPNREQTISNYLRQVTIFRGFIIDILTWMSTALLKLLPGDIVNQLVRIVSSIAFVAPIDLTQRLLSQHNGNFPIYYYLESYRSNYSVHDILGETVNGTAHVDDLGYVFNVKRVHAPEDPDHPFNIFRSKVVKLFTNFAKTGNPTPPNSIAEGGFDVVWEDSKDSGRQLIVNERAVMTNRVVGLFSRIFELFFYFIEPHRNGCSGSFFNIFDIYPS